MSSQSAKNVIFDFDGVLMDSFTALYQLVRDAFHLAGFELSEQQYRDFYQKNIKQAEKEFLSDEEAFSKVQKFINENKPEYYSKYARLFDFAPQVIRKLDKKGGLSIISSTAADTIKKELEKNDLAGLFDPILSSEQNFTKVETLQVMTKPDMTNYFVTDTVGDIRDGKTSGLKTIAVTWGFHDRSTLAQARPDFLIDTPHELLEIV